MDKKKIKIIKKMNKSYDNAVYVYRFCQEFVDILKKYNITDKKEIEEIFSKVDFEVDNYKRSYIYKRVIPNYKPKPKPKPQNQMFFESGGKIVMLQINGK